MTGEHDDLEQLFRHARTDDERHVPAFAAVLAGPPKRKPIPYLSLTFALAVVALVAVGIWRVAMPNEPRLVIAFTPGEMRVPTDYLLDTVDYPRAGEIPRLGTPDWFPIPVAADAATDTRRLP